MAEIEAGGTNSRYRDQLEAQQREKLRDLKDKLRIELETATSNAEKTKATYTDAYVVELSREKDDLDSKIDEIRTSNAKRIEDEKYASDAELAKVRKAHTEQIAKVKENNEKTMSQMKQRYEQAANELQRRNDKLDKA